MSNVPCTETFNPPIIIFFIYCVNLEDVRSWLATIFSTLQCLNIFCLFAITHKPCSVIHLHTLISQVTRCSLLFLLLSICLMRIRFSKPSFLIMCPKDFKYHFLILSIRVFLFLKLRRCSYGLLLFSVFGKYIAAQRNLNLWQSEYQLD